MAKDTASEIQPSHCLTLASDQLVKVRIVPMLIQEPSEPELLNLLGDDQCHRRAG